MACQSDEARSASLQGDACPSKNAMPPAENATSSTTKTLIVYYSYTGNTEEIAGDLRSLINADVIKVEPADKGLDYAANNYAIGTEQLTKIQNAPNDASSYPAIEFSSPDGGGQEGAVDMSKYNTIIIATPLWWSQMASNMQTFLFRFGPEMAGKRSSSARFASAKNIGLIVSSHSSGISGVERDAKRLVPDGKFFPKSLWINASNHCRRKALLEEWLKDINYNDSQNANTMNLKVNNHSMKVNLADNAATEALLTRLQNAPITYRAHDYGGFEKVGALGFTLPSNDTQITTEPGDIMLYTSNQLCIFFDSNSWQYTRIGKIEGMTASQLKDAFGTGEVSITLSLDTTTGIVSASASHPTTRNIHGVNGRKLAQVPTKGTYIEDGVKKTR